VGPNLIVIGRVFREDSPKVLGVEHQQMVRALAPDRADQAFNIWRPFPNPSARRWRRAGEMSASLAVALWALVFVRRLPTHAHERGAIGFVRVRRAEGDEQRRLLAADIAGGVLCLCRRKAKERRGRESGEQFHDAFREFRDRVLVYPRSGVLDDARSRDLAGACQLRIIQYPALAAEIARICDGSAYQRHE
jgi:hypothetical protein